MVLHYVSKTSRQRGPGRSPSGTRHGKKRRQGHGNQEQASKEEGELYVGPVGRGPAPNFRASGAAPRPADRESTIGCSIAQDEVRHLETSLAKAQKVAEIAEPEVGHLRDELR